METEEKLPGPVILDAVPISCSMSMSRSRDEDSPATNSLSMRLIVHDEVRTPDDRKLNGAEWWMDFYENGSGNELTEQHNAIGLINYYEAWQSEHYDIDDTPESFHAWVNVNSQTFTLLRDMAMAGKLPSSLRLRAMGFTYGWEPDGSTKEWDVKKHKNAVILRIEINTSLVKPSEPVPDSDESDAFQETPPPTERPELVAARGITKAIEQVHARIGWVIGLLAVTIAVVIFL